MSAVGRQVTNFVRACEALHWRLIEGDSLTIEDRDMIEHAAIELLMRAGASTDAHPGRPRTRGSNKALEKAHDEKICRG
jgi:hypothetical protein